MVAYFRGFCREKLGQSGIGRLHASPRNCSTAYIFPSTAEEFTVLRAAVQAHPSDSTAHYLLGTFYFSRGLTDSALERMVASSQGWARASCLEREHGARLCCT